LSDTHVHEVVVVNEAGIHARPSHMIVKLSQEFEAQIRLSHDERHADCASILSVMTLGAVCGANVIIEAEGPDGEQASNAMRDLFESGFEEES